MHLNWTARHFRSILIAILVLAAILRFAGLNWDGGYYLHPDERFMVMVTVDTAWPDSVSQYFDSATSPLNPYNTRHGTFVYGTFPMFLTKAVSTLIGKDVYGETHLAGRAISALADTGTVFLVAWIAPRFFGRQAGLLAGFLFACTVLHIQTAHYYTVDAISVFFATAAFATTVKGWDRRSFGWFATAGLMIGLAGASKPNYLIALAFLALPVAETVRRRGWSGLMPWSTDEQSRFPILPAVALSGLVAFWTFRIAQPYAFTGPSIWDIRLDPRWVNDLSYWQNAQSGLIDIKSSIQWVDRTPVVFILNNLVRWGMGPPLGFAALIGLALLVIRLIGARTWPSWWMLGMGGWCVSQLALYGTNMAQAQRYLMPIYPFLVVLAAGFLVELTGRLKMPLRGVGRHAASRAIMEIAPTNSRHRILTHLGTVLIGITVVYTLFYAVAFDSLFVRPLSRVEASEWIYQNVPAGSTLTSEYWDDGLPMRLPNEDADQYRYITLDLYAYEGPGSLKLSKLIGQLNQADYIILSSNRIIGSVPRQPERYPMASHYYEMLLNGDLGFDLVAEFSQKPELFGISLDDTNAEETLTVYEHPLVRIFKKSDRFDDARAYNELNTALGYGGVNYLPGDPLGSQMLLTPQEQQTYSADGTWWTKFDPHGITNTAPALWWYIAIQLMIVPTLPLAWLLFRRFPDHGYALSKILGLLIVTWIAWLLAALKLVTFGPLSISLSWFMVLIVAVVLARQHLTDMTVDFRARWRWLLSTELLFAASYAAMLWVRSLTPGFWQPTGESQTPFWYAIFNATVRSAHVPAYDPWFSGGKLHLANWGQMPWVMLTRLTGILPETAWNLAFAGIFALACITIWNAAAMLLTRLGMANALAGWTALLAPLTTVAGATLMLARRAGEGSWGFLPRPSSFPIPGAAGDMIYGFWQLLTQHPALNPAIAREGLRMDSGVIARNPFASMLAGNLDSVTTTLPVIALACAVAISLAVREDRDGGDQWRLDRIDLGKLVLGGGLAGAMLASSTWGFLPTLGLIAIGVVIRLITLHGFGPPWPLVRNTVLCLLIAGMVAFVSFWPAIRAVHLTQRDMRTGPATGLTDLLTLNGITFFVLLSWLGIHTIVVGRHSHGEGKAGRRPALALAALVIGAFGLALLLGSNLLFVMIVLLLVMISLWHLHRAPAQFLILGTISLAMVTIFMQDTLPMTADPFGTNSALNLGIFSWMLLGLAMTVASGWMVMRLDVPHRPLRTIAGIVWVGALALLLAAGVAYPVLATRSLAEAGEGTPRTLDTTAFLDDSLMFTPPGAQPVLAGDREAARWLMENVSGLPVILEATTSDYQIGGRISAMTGLPTVIGWNTPEWMMRPGWTELIGQRQAAVNRILGSRGTFASIEPLLRQYRVQLIYVGPVEQAVYPAASLEKFHTAAEDGSLKVLYTSETVTIYYYAG